MYEYSNILNTFKCMKYEILKHSIGKDKYQNVWTINIKNIGDIRWSFQSTINLCDIGIVKQSIIPDISWS